MRQVVEGDQASALMQLGHQFGRQFAVVEVARVGCDASQRPSQLRLLENLAGCVIMPIALKDAFRIRKKSQRRVVEFVRFVFAEGESILGQLDRRRDHPGQAQFAVFLLRISQAGDGTGRGNGAIAGNARLQVAGRQNVTFGVEIHIGRRGQRRFFPEIDEGRLAVMGTQQHKSAAAQITGNGMHHRQRKPCRHGSIDGVPARLENLHSGIGGQVMHAYHHAMLCADRRLAAIVNGLGGCLLG